MILIDATLPDGTSAAPSTAPDRRLETRGRDASSAHEHDERETNVFPSRIPTQLRVARTRVAA
jgi:hypothetical protein